MRRCLRDDGVDTDGLEEVDAPTGTAHIAVLDGGENAIVVVSGANAAITELDDDAKTRIEDARYLVAQFERPIELDRRGVRRRARAGHPTVLTPAPVQPVDQALLQLVDVLIPNAQEACELAGISDETEAARRPQPDRRTGRHDARRARSARGPRRRASSPRCPRGR